MRLVLFRDQRTVDDVIQITLEHASSTLSAGHTCYSDGSHDEHEGEAAIHRVTNAHLIAIHDAIGCTLREALADLVGLAERAMREANRDGAEYDIDGELADARAALNVAKQKAHVPKEPR